MADLMELAERVEALSGPDREIDGLIAIYIAPDTPYIVGNKPGRFPQEPIHGTFLDCLVIKNGKDRADYIGAPHYTASFEAAMTLVPEGWWVGQLAFCPPDFRSDIDREWHAEIAGPITWETLDCGPEPQYECEGGNAATPALALCAAALRARAGK